MRTHTHTHTHTRAHTHTRTRTHTHTHQQPSFHLPDEAGSEGGEDVEEGGGHASILIPVVLGTVVLMAVVLTALVCRHRYCCLARATPQ